MNARLTIAVLSALGSLFASAQNVTEDPKADPVLDAISEFNNRDKNKPNEVTVVLDPVGEPPAPVAKEEPKITPPPGEQSKPVEPVLVTGKPPEGTAIVANPAPKPEPAPAPAVAPVEEAPKPQPGLAVRIEKLQTGNGLVDPKQIKLLAPFPAKPLSQPPAGWHLVASESATPFTRKVEVAQGSEVTLTIRPHLLVPDADGANVFSISEPGYERSLGYEQTATVGAILSNSIRQLEDDSKQLGNAIDSLQQLLISLPKQEPQPVEQAKPAPVRKK
ncbi:MAG: hypothetical protein ABIT37_22810 [Luteolibacter sp.]